MTDSMESLGIIAGNRSLPLIFAKQSRSMGVQRLVAVGFEGETDPALADLVSELVWLKVGQLSKLISAFTSRQIQRCVMVGPNRPQKTSMTSAPICAPWLCSCGSKKKMRKTIFGAIADELQKDGVNVVEATPWLKPLMPASGFHLGPKLSSTQEADVQFGFRTAKEISRLEIGQTIVVKNGTVLAVEGLEGTDKCLARGGELSGKDGGAVAVKVAKHNHDLRFDIPCLGPQTLETCATSRICVLAFEASNSLLLEQETCRQLTHKHKLSLLTCG